MYIFDPLHVVFRQSLTTLWIFQEECIMHISSGVTLGLEKSIEVPEGTLYKSVSGHLIEPHFE